MWCPTRSPGKDPGSWNTAKRAAGLGDLHLHNLRHSFASFLINSGRSLYEVQRILGHSSIAMTSRYSHLAQDTLLEVTNVASKLIDLGSKDSQETQGVSKRTSSGRWRLAGVFKGIAVLGKWD